VQAIKPTAIRLNDGLLFSRESEQTSMHTKSDRGTIKESSNRPWKTLFDKNSYG
jgi:hypothetical protein